MCTHVVIICALCNPRHYPRTIPTEAREILLSYCGRGNIGVLDRSEVEWGRHEEKTGKPRALHQGPAHPTPQPPHPATLPGSLLAGVHVIDAASFIFALDIHSCPGRQHVASRPTDAGGEGGVGRAREGVL